MVEYKLVHKSGDILEFKSELSLENAVKELIFKAKNNRFIRDLLIQYMRNNNLSPIQTGWVVYLAEREIKRKNRKNRRVTLDF